jgi:two-component system cell cycle sensor histidine kinase/response regulator CckA
MTNGIVHDFNNFLQVLLVYANFLVYHHDLSEAALDDAKRVFDASEKAGRLTSRLLSFSQQRFGASSVVDLNSLVDGMSMLMRKVLPERVSITYDLNEDLPAVYVSPALVEQVLANLLLNAGETLSKGGAVTVSTHTVDEQDAYVRYRISAQPATYTVLHIVASLPPDVSLPEGGVDTSGFNLENLSLTVHEHGGRIREEDSDDGGLRYWLYLPNALVDEPDPTPEGATRREMGGSERILIVEDDALVRWTIQRMLKAFGYTVFAAENATEALVVIRNEKLAMMITDVVMPETDGPTLIRLAREVVHHLPVLMISGYAEQQIVTEALLDTRTAFLPKPFLPGQLAAAVRKVLDLGS